MRGIAQQHCGAAGGAQTLACPAPKFAHTTSRASGAPRTCRDAWRDGRRKSLLFLKKKKQKDLGLA
jgi:hypothetical protein